MINDFEKYLGLFLSYLRLEKNASEYTIHNYDAAIRGFYEIIGDLGIISLNIKTPPVKRPEKTPSQVSP